MVQASKISLLFPILTDSSISSRQSHHILPSSHIFHHYFDHGFDLRRRRHHHRRRRLLTSGNDGSPASLSNRFRRTLLPSISPSSWIVDAEGEKSVFDRSDSTVRLRLIQSPGRLRQRHHPPTAGARRFSVEYDSAKYDDDFNAARGGAERRRRNRYAPSVVVDSTTPMFHPRLEARSRHTWVVRSGGDRYGNYYGGDHYGDSRSPVDRRMDRIRTRMRDGVPRSNPVFEAGRGAAATTTNGGGVENFRNRLSRWLENDGWMPRRATVDLVGNLVSVNEVGFGHSRGKALGCGNTTARIQKGGLDLRGDISLEQKRPQPRAAAKSAGAATTAFWSMPCDPRT